jgi:excisionase family DNA binding protein
VELSVQQVAGILKVGDSVVRRLIRQGKLRDVRVAQPGEKWHEMKIDSDEAHSFAARFDWKADQRESRIASLRARKAAAPVLNGHKAALEAAAGGPGEIRYVERELPLGPDVAARLDRIEAKIDRLVAVWCEGK